MDIKPILNAGLAAQAAGLATSSLTSKKKKRGIGLARTGVGLLTGTALLSAQSNIISGLK